MTCNPFRFLFKWSMWIQPLEQQMWNNRFSISMCPISHTPLSVTSTLKGPDIGRVRMIFWLNSAKEAKRRGPPATGAVSVWFTAGPIAMPLEPDRTSWSSLKTAAEAWLPLISESPGQTSSPLELTAKNLSCLLNVAASSDKLTADVGVNAVEPLYPGTTSSLRTIASDVSARSRAWWRTFYDIFYQACTRPIHNVICECEREHILKYGQILRTSDASEPLALLVEVQTKRATWQLLLAAGAHQTQGFIAHARAADAHQKQTWGLASSGQTLHGGSKKGLPSLCSLLVAVCIAWFIDLHLQLFVVISGSQVFI